MNSHCQSKGCLTLKATFGFARREHFGLQEVHVWPSGCHRLQKECINPKKDMSLNLSGRGGPDMSA